jgi:hypothetical protein
MIPKDKNILKLIYFKTNIVSIITMVDNINIISIQLIKTEIVDVSNKYCIA